MSEFTAEFSGSVATATFNRPEARNAMTWAMYDGLTEFCERVDADETVRVAVLRGAGGKAFVAGTDISQFLEFESAEDGKEYEERIESVLGRLEGVRVPTIAMIDGYAIGGGLSLAAACDLRICTPNAKFGVPIARTVGNCLSMPSYARLVQLIGSARVLRLIFTAGFISADEALRVGLASEVVEDAEERTKELCAQLAAQAPLTMLASKRAIRRLRENSLPPDEDLISLCYGSEDFREGVAAFVEKRKPSWRGH
jgi:enoyl-CoA hydratase